MLALLILALLCPDGRRGVLVSPPLLRVLISSSVPMRSLAEGVVVKHMQNGSPSEMKLSSGFWSYTVERKTKVQ